MLRSSPLSLDAPSMHMDVDIYDAACLWLSSTYPALPHHYDDTLLHLEECTSLATSYTRIPSHITHQQQMLVLAKHAHTMRACLDEEQGAAYRHHEMWTQQWQQAEVRATLDTEHVACIHACT